MNRAEYRQVALLRLADAQALLRIRRYAAAYYLAGYAIECALKACIAQRFQRSDVPELKLVRDFYVHDLVALLRVAELDDVQAREARSDPQFDLYWSTVRTWREVSRYDQQRSRVQAEDLVRAIADRDHGVLRWLQQYW